ncbi:MAG: leucine-rich repeat protein [Ruminococcus sp.]|nr:leucine-rich repeat protein [Ruminococcus sp.]
MQFRKTLSLLVSAAMVLGCGTELIPPAIAVSAADEESSFITSGDWRYELVEGGARVTEHLVLDPDSYVHKVTLPTELDGYKVVSFAYGAFKNDEMTYEVYVPDDMTAEFDDNWLFESRVCDIHQNGLWFSTDTYRTDPGFRLYSWEKKKTIYDNDDIGVEPVATTMALANVTTPAATTPTAAVTETENDDTIYDVVVPDKIIGHPVTEMSESIFANVTNIGALTLPDTLKYIDAGMFMFSSITSVNIPKSTEVIPDNCFSGCTSLEKVYFHDDLFIVSNSAFAGCPCYDSIPDKYKDMTETAYSCYQFWWGTKTVGDWVLYFKKYFDPEKETEVALYAPVGDRRELVIPKEVGGYTINTVARQSILKNRNVTEVSFEDGVTVVPNMSNSSIEKITIPTSVTQLKNVFQGCDKLTSVTIPSNITYLYKTFTNCKNLKEIIFEGDEITIDGGSFSNVPISSIELPGTCTLYPNALPTTCKDISFRAGDKVRITGMPIEAELIVTDNNGLTSVKKRLADFRSLKFDPDVKEVVISGTAFSKSNIEEVQFPNGKVTLEFGAFKDCPNLKEITFSGDADIASNAFSGCPNLESVTLGGKCTVGDLAFSDCSKLTNVSLDETQDISARCFNGCKNLFCINGVEVVPENSFEVAPELNDYFYRSCQTALEVGFVDRFTMNRVKEVVAATVDDSMTDIEKVKALHDWVCNNTVYDSSDENDLANHVDSAVFFDGVAVCEGYAKAYNLLLHEAGIESCYVYNSSHAWNMVKLGDDWYHSDTTWDDGDKVSYDWFLCTDAELKAAGGLHSEWSLNSPSYLHSSQPTVLPTAARVFGDVDADGLITFDDAAKLRDIIIGGGEYGCPFDLSCDGALTSADVAALLAKLSDNSNDMGDVNGDGRVDSSDASAVLAEYSRLSTGEEPTFSREQALAGDLNSDGRNDSTDASKILGYYSLVSTGGTADIAAYLG